MSTQPVQPAQDRRPQLLKIPEVLDALQVARSTFYGLVQEQKIRVLKINGASRVLASDLEAYIASLPVLDTSDLEGPDQ